MDGITAVFVVSQNLVAKTCDKDFAPIAAERLRCQMTKTEQLIKEVEEDMQGHGVSNEQAEKLVKMVRYLIGAEVKNGCTCDICDKIQTNLDRIAEGKG